MSETLTVRRKKYKPQAPSSPRKRVTHPGPGASAPPKIREQTGFSGDRYAARTSPEERSRRVDQVLKSQDGPKIKVNETELVASICRESFYEFVKEFWSTVIPEKAHWNWHIEYLCGEMQTIAEKVFKGEVKDYDLCVNISPGTTKSTIISVMFPAWIWTRMPSARVIGASYSFPLAMDLSVKCRDVVGSDKYKETFPDVVLRDDQNTKGYFKNTKGGFRYAVGVNGSVTGMHAHFILIDDPLDPNEAMSTADLASANYWIKNTLSSRKVDKAVTATVLVMQRLHQDDPTAQFLERPNVRHVCLPAEIDREDHKVNPVELVKFYKHGLMDPVRLNRKVLMEYKAYGEQFYSGQFLQDPVPAGGAMFKVDKFRFGAPPDRWQQLVRFWDKAGTFGGGAYTVGVLLGLDVSGRVWVLDVVRGQWESYAREKEIAKAAELDGFQVLVGVEQEPGSGGKESADNTATRTLRGYKVITVKVDKTTGGKVERADPWAVQVNAGNAYLPRPEDAEWVKPFIEEHRYFPYSRYKDQVDAASGAFTLLSRPKTRVGGIAKKEHVEAVLEKNTRKDTIRGTKPYRKFERGTPMSVKIGLSRVR